MQTENELAFMERLNWESTGPDAKARAALVGLKPAEWARVLGDAYPDLESRFGRRQRVGVRSVLAVLRAGSGFCCEHCDNAGCDRCGERVGVTELGARLLEARRVQPCP